MRQQTGSQPTTVGPDRTVTAARPDLHSAIADLLCSIDAEPHPHPTAVLEQFVMLAATHIEGVGHAAVMEVAGDGTLRPSAASSIVARLIEKIQEDMVQGPCLDAAMQHQMVRADDLTDEPRWRGFTLAVLCQTPVRSILCAPLHTLTGCHGVLSLYADTPYAFGAQTCRAAAILATHAALTVQAVQRRRQLRSGLSSRDIIGQAKGMLIERYHIEAGAAFMMLTRLSQQAGKPIVVIAKELLEARSRAGH